MAGIANPGKNTTAVVPAQSSAGAGRGAKAGTGAKKKAGAEATARAGVGAGAHGKAELDLRCYFVTGAGTPEQIILTARAAALGGAGIIQVRSKPITAAALYDLTAGVAEEVRRVAPDTKVLVDDRVDVALALIAEGHPVHGVHLGHEDLPVASARALLGPEAIIGLTTGTLELIHAANTQAALLDYVGCGPFQPTPTKDSARPPLGIEGYPPIVAASALPVVAIGGVTVNDVANLAATGVAGVAIVRGFMNAEHPRHYAAEVLTEFHAGQVRSGLAQA